MMHRISSSRCRLRFINILLDVTKTTTTIMTEMMIEMTKTEQIAATILTRLLKEQHGFSSDSGIGWKAGKIRESPKMFLGFLVLLGFTSSDGAGGAEVSRKYFKLGCTS